MTLTDDARLLGESRGKNAAEWADVDSDNAATLIRQYDDGDPSLFDGFSGPLSGEWAGDPTPNSLWDELGVSEDDRDLLGDDLCTEYEQAYEAAFWARLMDRAHYYADPD